MYKKEFKKKLLIKILENFSKKKTFFENSKVPLELLKVDKKDWKRILTYHFPNQFLDLMNFLSEITFDKLSIKKKNISKMRVSEKINFLVFNRLLILESFTSGNKDFLFYLLRPTNVIEVNKLLFNIADEIWFLAEDKSLDFNYYSKRIILMNLYLKSYLFFINDKSEKKIATSNYIKKLIKRNSKIGKFKFAINNIYNKLRSRFS